jgi:hypothetical protein
MLILPKIMALAMPAWEQTMSVKESVVAFFEELTMPTNGANLGVSSDSAMLRDDPGWRGIKTDVVSVCNGRK